jgi:hypothetical protein
MDELIRAYYEVLFERDFLKKKGDRFQDFFCEIMEKCHPNDFLRVRPWGRHGDRKNDGYLQSTRTLFQVYAPNEMEAAKAVKKIRTDFKGALPYWKQYFDTWIFVHNSREGLSPDVTRTLLELKRTNKPLKVKSWGYEELRQNVFGLDERALASLLGPAPSRKDILNVGFDKLQEVLLAISRLPPCKKPDLRPIPEDKLVANGLSESIKILLSAGQSKEPRVEQFFNLHPNTGLGDEVASAFNKKYKELRGATSDPNEVFRELHVFAGGLNRGNPDHEAAVLAVLSYLFAKCEIFENPRNSKFL